MKTLKYCLIVPALVFCFSGALAITGCERELEHTKKTEVDGDKAKTKEHVVKEDSNGNVTSENKKTEENLKTGETKTKTEVKQE